MNDFLQWHFDFGDLTVGLIVFFSGIFIGRHMHRDRCRKEKHKEAVRLAVTNTVQLEKMWSDDYDLDSGKE